MTKGLYFLYVVPVLLIFLFGISMLAGIAIAGCNTRGCHEGIEDIMPPDSGMARSIKALGLEYGDPGGCVVCHGGNPNEESDRSIAHSGAPEGLKDGKGPKAFYPDPGSIWIADNTCGVCHPGYVRRVKLSLMNTEAGKICGNLHTWGFKEARDYRVPYGNYAIKDIDGPVPMVGSRTYKEYMEMQISKYPFQYPKVLARLPYPDLNALKLNPRLAALTYQRHECQRCHVGVRGRERRGDYRGMGCSACHILYANDGFYEGKDKSIDKDEPGHILRHSMVGTRRTGGIPVETCNTCHNRGKRIGVSFQGLMEFPYGSPYGKGDKKQPKLHTKTYLFISDDLHHQYRSRKGNPKGGLLCQDCHTSIDVHGDGNIPGTTLAQVEIECSDCHGTPTAYPWELPIGFGDEAGKMLSDKPRGVGQKRNRPEEEFGFPYEPEDGFILSARGNPLGNVIRRGNDIILHSATGQDFKVPVLKNIASRNEWKSLAAKTAMLSVKRHMEKMECYSCHASWVPQCYGCHVKVSYAPNAGQAPMGTDWTANGNAHMENGLTPDAFLGTSGIESPGKVSESRSYLRWEEPIIGYNGEGRISPLMPGCQVVYSVIGPDGRSLAQNRIEKSPDEARSIGQKRIPLAIDMSPVQPHTVQRQARTCESCHVDPKAVGLGISGGRFGRYDKNVVEDLMNAKTGQIIPRRYQVQIPAIPQLTFDWSKILDVNGTQLVTVGTHWPLSRALNKKELDVMRKGGTCIGCHRYTSDKSIWEGIGTIKRIDQAKHVRMMMDIMGFVGKKGLNSAQH